MMNQGRLLMLKTWLKAAIILALSVSSIFGLTSANAQSTYQISTVKDVTPTPYYVANYKKTLYAWDKTHTKRITVLNQLPGVSWYATQKVTIIHGHQTTTYLHIASEYGLDYGYVPAKDMRKGFDPTDDEKPAYHPTTSTTGSQIPVKRVSEKAFSKVIPSLTKNTYYQTTKKLTVKMPFSVYISGTINEPITLPVGTVVAGNRSRTEMTIASSYLSQNLLKAGYQQNLWTDNGESYTPNPMAFKAIPRPAYLPKNGSHGDLYLGGVNALRNQYNALSKQSIQLTTNGYVEVHQNNPQDRAIAYTAQPTTSVKIKRTQIKGHTCYLYLAKNLNGFKTTKVRYHGTTQYRLAFVNQQKTYSITFENDDDFVEPSYYGLMSFGGKTFYTPYGTIPNDN